MLVVTDTSPINYLLLTGYVDVLPVLHGNVVIPQAVAGELLNPRTPETVRQWVAAPPSWCTMQSPRGPLDPALAYLGEGEYEALMLCQELSTDALLTDDTEAYDAARERGIAVIRTLALSKGRLCRGCSICLRLSPGCKRRRSMHQHKSSVRCWPVMPQGIPYGPQSHDELG